CTKEELSRQIIISSTVADAELLAAERCRSINTSASGADYHACCDHMSNTSITRQSGFSSKQTGRYMIRFLKTTRSFILTLGVSVQDGQTANPPLEPQINSGEQNNQVKL
ncbi:hypothetical protein OS493_038718, partial [Desmophyllum pertusum]